MRMPDMATSLGKCVRPANGWRTSIAKQKGKQASSSESPNTITRIPTKWQPRWQATPSGRIVAGTAGGGRRKFWWRRSEWRRCPGLARTVLRVRFGRQGRCGQGRAKRSPDRQQSVLPSRRAVGRFRRHGQRETGKAGVENRAIQQRIFRADRQIRPRNRQVSGPRRAGDAGTRRAGLRRAVKLAVKAHGFRRRLLKFAYR